MANDLVRVLTPLEAVASRRARIDELVSEILEIQEKCPHSRKDVEDNVVAQTGSMGTCIDLKWSTYKCLDCDKQWSSDVTSG